MKFNKQKKDPLQIANDEAKIALAIRQLKAQAAADATAPSIEAATVQFISSLFGPEELTKMGQHYAKYNQHIVKRLQEYPEPVIREYFNRLADRAHPNPKRQFQLQEEGWREPTMDSYDDIGVQDILNKKDPTRQASSLPPWYVEKEWENYPDLEKPNSSFREPKNQRLFGKK